jgi:hypothetical protein
MRFKVRIQESLTSEHIYRFNVEYQTIECTSYYSSNRSGDGDIWGYDWTDHYFEDFQKELSDLKKELAGSDYHEDNLYSFYTQEADEKLEKLRDKYNPCCHKTIHGKTYLTGTAYSGVLNKYLPPIPREEFDKLVRETAHKLIDEMEIK